MLGTPETVLPGLHEGGVCVEGGGGGGGNEQVAVACDGAAAANGGIFPLLGPALGACDI